MPQGTPPLIFDRKLLRARRDRASQDFKEHEALFALSAEMLIERLQDIKQEFVSVLELGAHQGGLATSLKIEGRPFIVTTDLSEKMVIHCPEPRMVVDEEFLPFKDASFDLVLSNLSLHWVNDLPGLLAETKRILRPGGLFLAALIGGESLFELRTSLMEAELSVTGGVSPRISPMVDLPNASALLQRAGFVLPVADIENVTVTYRDALALMQDLRGMGETAAHSERSRQFLRRAVILEASRLYTERFTDPSGAVLANFVLIFLHGVKGLKA